LKLGPLSFGKWVKEILLKLLLSLLKGYWEKIFDFYRIANLCGEKIGSRS